MTKLFVIVDPSLSRRQQFVQGTHAVAQYCLDYPNTKWRNYTLVMLKSDVAVDFFADVLAQEGIEYSSFNEPYYNNIMTAVCALDIEDLTCKLQLI